MSQQNSVPSTQQPITSVLNWDVSGGQVSVQSDSAEATAAIRKPKVRASELEGRGWLNTGGKNLSLHDLRGKIVVLDFWTFCCVNCLHVLDELRELEEANRDCLVIVGVHSPKFEHEADPDALAAAVERYQVEHPVLDDPNLATWTNYAARAWPTLTVVDPEGYIVASMSGEGHAHNLEILVRELIEEHQAKGTLHRGDGPYVAPEPEATTLRFPSKVVELDSGNLLVSSAGHHQLVELEPDAETVVQRIGTGERGHKDGSVTDAQFSEPNGLTLVPAELREDLGYNILIADTVNHQLRGLNTATGQVTTVAGTGKQWMQGQPTSGAALDVALSTPWDVRFSPEDGVFVIAMAGIHQLWFFDPRNNTVGPFAGTTNEGLEDGPLASSWWAQTSGLSLAEDGALWVADSETSALRKVKDGQVTTVVGKGLFDFGHRDGAADQALFQHPLGVTVLPDGSVAVADTYNSALRRYNPQTNTVSTLAGDLREPSDAVVVYGHDGPELLVVESAAHRLTRLSLNQEVLRGSTVEGHARRTQRPATTISAGQVQLQVVFVPPTGHKLDEQFGPSTQLQVSSTPPNLLVDGGGTGTDLRRTLTINPEVTEGVLHVAARAASCDADPAIEFPACHMHQQDWGVPVKVADGGDATLELSLLG